MAEAPPADSRSAISARSTSHSRRPRPAAERSPPRSRGGTVDSRATVSIGQESDGDGQGPRPTSQRPVSANTRVRSLKTASFAEEDGELSDFHSPSPRASPRHSSPESPMASPRRAASRCLHPDLSFFAGCIDPVKFDQEEEADKSPRWANRTDNYFHRPSSVARFIENADVAEFIAWVEGMPQGWGNVHSIFAKEAAAPIGGQCIHAGGHQPTAGLAKQKWVRLLMNWRYPNEAGLHTVWDEVAKEIKTDMPEKGIHAVTGTGNAAVEAEITLPQFKRFERRVCSVNAVLSPTHENSPARRFVKWLRKKYGSSLLAWRLMLDVYSTGRVAYADFLNGCRSMGVGSQGRSVWSNLKVDQGYQMEFHELDPEEGNTLEEFAKVLLEQTELKMDKAWMQMDVMHQHYLTLDQFKAGCLAFGWRGNAKLLFKGLDSSGLGRLKEDDFRYISKGSHIGAQRFMASQKPIAAFVSWCNQDIGGVERLLELVGFYGKRELDVEELAEKLESLGFYGSSKVVASKAAQQPQGSVVTAASLSKLIKCNHYKPDELGSASLAFRSSPSRSMVEHRFGWDAAVNDFALHNGRLCQYSRGFFGRESKHPIATQSQVAQAYTPNVSSPPRPEGWESQVQNRSPNGGDVSPQSLQNNSTRGPRLNSKCTGDFSDGAPRDLQQNRTRDPALNSKYTKDFSDRSPRNMQREVSRDPMGKIPAHLSKYAGDCSDKFLESPAQTQKSTGCGATLNSKYAKDFSDSAPRDMQRHGTRDTILSSRGLKGLPSRPNLSSRSSPDLQRHATRDSVDEVPPQLGKYTGDRSDKTFRSACLATQISGKSWR